MVERYSHPERNGREATPLQSHLEDVAARATSVVPDRELPDGTSLNSITRRAALVHDVGKLTTWFQQHIDTVAGSPDGPTDHSLLGAYLAHFVCQGAESGTEAPLVGFLAVAKHHGMLPNTGEYVRRTTIGKPGAATDHQEQLRSQVENIDRNSSELADELVQLASNGESTWAEFADAVREGRLASEIFDAVSDGSPYNLAADPVSPTYYDAALQIWSALVLADKTSAAHAPEYAFDPHRPNRETLRRYVADLGGEETSNRERRLNRARREARESVIDNARSFATNRSEETGGVATLTLPTGLGKTLTGLDAAMTIQREADAERIVYALPFTSVIDQVVDEVQTIFTEEMDTDERDAGLLTVHHHLADSALDLTDETDADADVAELLGESWRTGLVVTTFVQLFESLAGPKNMQSMKIPALHDSVIVIDEPQGIPLDWWPLVRRLVKMLTDRYGATVIAMTATQPRLFPDAPELVGDSERYYAEFERVTYNLDQSVRAFPDDDGTRGYGECASELLQDARKGLSVLSVCNTIDSAREQTESLKDQTEGVSLGAIYEQSIEDEPRGERIAEEAIEAEGLPICHLSTRLRPRDRSVMLAAVQELTYRGVPLVVISTQLIEAGVDVSFDAVYRDFAPVDSIVQAAGRCNRSFEQETGSVTVWWLDAPEEHEMNPAEAVYNHWGESRLSVTKTALDEISAESESLSESDIAWDAVKEYYRLLDDRNVGNPEYVEYVEQAQANDLGRCSLIDQRNAVDVVVCRTDAEVELVTEKIPNAWQRGDYDELDRYMEQTKPLQVSVPAYGGSMEREKLAQLNTLPTGFDSELRWIDPSRREYAEYFDSSTGLVVPDDTVDRRFL